MNSYTYSNDSLRRLPIFRRAGILSSMEVNRPQLQVSNPLRPFEKVAVKKLCPKCGSLFVTKKECEACGYQFWVDLLGEPFGARSFFVMRDDFTHQYRWVYRFAMTSWGKQHQALVKYRRTILKRFEILCGYFFDEFDKNKERRRLFIFEAQEIIHEYALIGGNLSDLWLIIEKGDHHPLFPQLAKKIEAQNQEPAAGIDLKNFLVEGRFLGTFTYSFLFKLGMGAAAIVLAAYLYMRAFLLS